MPLSWRAAGAFRGVTIRKLERHAAPQLRGIKTHRLHKLGQLLVIDYTFSSTLYRPVGLAILAPTFVV